MEPKKITFLRPSCGCVSQGVQIVELGEPNSIFPSANRKIGPLTTCHAKGRAVLVAWNWWDDHFRKYMRPWQSLRLFHSVGFDPGFFRFFLQPNPSGRVPFLKVSLGQAAKKRTTFPVDVPSNRHGSKAAPRQGFASLGLKLDGVAQGDQQRSAAPFGVWRSRLFKVTKYDKCVDHILNRI